MTQHFIWQGTLRVKKFIKCKKLLCPKLLCFQFQLGIPICLFWSANFIFGNPKEANWNTKSEIGNIEVLDIRYTTELQNFHKMVWNNAAICGWQCVPALHYSKKIKSRGVLLSTMLDFDQTLVRLSSDLSDSHQTLIRLW